MLITNLNYYLITTNFKYNEKFFKTNITCYFLINDNLLIMFNRDHDAHEYWYMFLCFKLNNTISIANTAASLVNCKYVSKKGIVKLKLIGFYSHSILLDGNIQGNIKTKSKKYVLIIRNVICIFTNVKYWHF